MDSSEPAAEAMRVELPRRRHGSMEAYALLLFTMVCWGGNSVAGRLAVGEVSPMVITCLRWAIVSIFLLSLKPRELKQAWPELRRNALKIILMAVSGFSIFNAMFYVAAHHTTAVNIAILQGAIPVFVVMGAFAIHGTRISLIQAAGIATTLVGVAVVATRGELAALGAFEVNRGDALILIASFLYAGYTLGLRDRPNVPSLVFFAAMAVIAFVAALPLLAYEMLAGTALWPTPKGWAILVFIALFPSFLAQLGFMRGVQLIGPGRAGLFANLTPIFGAGLAVLILGEPFGLYHFVAVLLVIGGILASELAGRRRARAAEAERA
jgi:drug/metabolite transporter (DMT)-like permease